MDPIDYSQWTVPAEVQASDKAQREDPNYRRPRKLPPRIVFTNVVKRAQQEKAAALAAKERGEPNPSVSNPQGSAHVSSRTFSTPRPQRAQATGDQASFSSAAVNPASNEEDADDRSAPPSPASSASSASSDDSLDSLPLIIRSHLRKFAAALHSDSRASSTSSEDSIPLMTLSRARNTATASAPHATSTPPQPPPPPPRLPASAAAPHLFAALSTATDLTPLPLPAPTSHHHRPSAIHPSIPLPATPPAPLPLADATDRCGPRADSWTWTEAFATTSLMIYVFDELPHDSEAFGPGVAGLTVDEKFRLVAEMLGAVYGVERGVGAVRSWWRREGRVLAGMGGEGVKRED